MTHKINYCNLLLVCLGLLTLAGCKRDMVTEIVSVTPPELHVIVYQGTDQNVRVSGVTVNLFATEADRTAGKNAVASVATDAGGKAVFTKDNFKKGVMYVSAAKGALVGAGATPYLLQNDGQTLFWVSVK